MSKKKVKVFTMVLVAFFLFALVPTARVFASGDSNNELPRVIDSFKGRNIVVKDGLFLNKGEKLSLEQFLVSDANEPISAKWTSSKGSIGSITSDGSLTGLAQGTTVVSAETKDAVFLFEVFVNDPSLAKTSRVASYSTTEAVGDSPTGFYKIFIDPGHGGSDPGALSSDRTLRESDVNLTMAFKLKEKLERQGFDVKMSRYDDTYISLESRSQMANQWGASLFVSLHQNSYNATVGGIETLYYKDGRDSYNFAVPVQNRMIQATGMANRGVKDQSIYVLRTTNMPAILTESGFISNPTEAAKMRTPEYVDTITTSILNGINDYVGFDPSGRGEENLQLLIDKPTNGQALENTNVQVAGRVLNKGNVNKVRIMLNSKFIGEAPIINGAFNYMVDSNILPVGANTITAQVKLTNGSLRSVDRTFYTRIPELGNTALNKNLSMYFDKVYGSTVSGIGQNGDRKFSSPFIKKDYGSGTFKATVEVKNQDGTVKKIDRNVIIRK